MLKIKNKRLLKAVFSVFMVVVICLATMGSVPIKVYSAYIEPALKKVLETANDTDLIPVDIWLYDIDTEEVDEKVFAKTGLSRETISDEKRSAELTHAEVDAYIEAERTLYAEAQTKRSNEFLKQYSNIFTSKATESSEVFYVSKYAPSIQMELTPAQIAKLAKDLSVESIYYSPELNISTNSVIGNQVTGANYVRDTLGLTGSGVKIGILEAPLKKIVNGETIIRGGLPERGNYNMPTNKIVFDPEARDDQDNLSWHASLVASIIMGQYDGTYEGIVPDAYVYATYLSLDEQGYRRSWRECAEWLIGRGVNVINMSMQCDSNFGIYGEEDRWADHVALQHHVHIVVASGNYNESIGKRDYYVTSPALAYNVITVGSLEDNNNTNFSDDVIASYSCYQDGNNPKNAHKPDIVAPGNCILTPTNITNHNNTHTNCCGTSFAAPFVTGIVAQLCQADTYLKTNPAAMKAVLCATAVTSQHSYTPSDNGYDKYGAGLVSAEEAYVTILNNNYLSGIFYPHSEEYSFQDHTITLNSNKQRLRVALTWLNYKYIDGEDHSSLLPNEEYTMSNLDIRIYSPALGTVFESNSTKGNVEIIDISEAPADTYYVEIVASPASLVYANYSLAWWYE